MVLNAPPSLTPRKRPRQARAEVTLDAIYEATIQVLTAVGSGHLTTTRVARRAGVSIGTLYQYFPHKQALIYAVNGRYLDALAEKIEITCRSHSGAELDEMVKALIDTYWKAKTERPDVTRALYRSVAELDNQNQIDVLTARVDAACAAMLASASDADISEIDETSQTLLTVIFGTVRNAFERNLPDEAVEALHRNLTFMCGAYVRSRRTSAMASL